MEAATASFAEKGFAATAMRELAAAARCTKPALYYYFKNKEALFLEVVRVENERVTEILEATLRDEGQVRRRIDQALGAYFEHVRQHPHGLATLLRAEMDREEGQPSIDFKGMRDAHLSMAKQLLDAGIRGGELRDDLDLEEAALMIVAMVELRCRMFLFEGRPLPAPQVLLDMFMRGVASK